MRIASVQVAAILLLALGPVAAELPHLDVAGSVIDVEGNPLAGADVWLYYDHSDDGLRNRVAGRAKTGVDGGFRFEKTMVYEAAGAASPKKDAPTYAVIARHPDHGIDFRILFENDRADNVEITLGETGAEMSKSGALRKITVQDDKGNPVPGAKV
jgi:protocatechuate 3,4-dioxygenase beta subunit